jgi:hypothetical protein
MVARAVRHVMGRGVSVPAMRVATMHMSSVAGTGRVTEVRRVANVAAVPTMPGMAEMRQATDRHRHQSSTTEGEAETIEVHTEYYGRIVRR